MARRYDSGWRDHRLTEWHGDYGIVAPAPGMTLPMVEYDRGVPVGIVNYYRRDVDLPYGGPVVKAIGALSSLTSERGDLPFITAVYDPRTWAFQVRAHNKAGASLLGPDGTGWRALTEAGFAAMLYRMRGRQRPALSMDGVVWEEQPWQDEQQPMYKLPWPGADMSARRRDYEPVVPVAGNKRIPCVDIDLAVADQDGNLALVVDYKHLNAKVNLDSTNMQALSSLRNARADFPVAAMVAQYFPDAGGWSFTVHCLNQAARNLLAYVMGATGSASRLARVIGGEQVVLNESLWLDVLRAARDL